MTLDANGNVISLRKRNGQSITLAYDNLNRLLSRTYPTSADNITYTYDLLGRTTAANKTGYAISYLYDNAGRLTSTTAGGKTLAYQYDPAGNRTRLTWPETAFYVTSTYDALNRPTAIKETGTVNLATYAYDDLSRRTTVTLGNSTTTSYAYSTQSALSTLTHNLTGTANSAGTSTAIHSYGPYGEPNIATGIRFRYTGQQFLGSLNLYYYKARFYSPALGRFLQTDPIGTADDLNLYAYVGNNPINFSDSSGLTAAAASMLLGKVGSTSADQFALGFIPGYDLYSASQNPNATMLDYGVGVLGILPGMGKGAGIGIRAADNLVGAVARGLPDSALVCRGGTCTADRFISGSGVSLDASGKLQGVSVNSAAGKTVEQLSVGIPNKQIGVTTVGDVRQAGGDVIPSPTVENPYHCTLCGVTPQQAEQLMTPAIKNPN